MEINKIFLEKVLGGESIESFELNPGCSKGDNMMGSLVSVSVLLANGNRKVDLVCKLFPENKSSKEEMVLWNLFWIENAMYSMIFPKIEKLLIKNSKMKEDLPIPELFDCFNDDKNDYLILEDLRTKGYKMKDKFIGFSIPETKFILRELAKFHSWTFALLEEEGETFFDSNFISKSGKSKSLNIFKHNFWSKGRDYDFGKLLFQNLWDCALNLLKERNVDLWTKLLNNKTILKENIADHHLFLRNSLEQNGYFEILTHGDLWINNILIKYNENELIKSIKFIDFQLSRKGSIFEDLIYLITQSVKPALWKDNIENLLDIYFTSFVSNLESLNCPMPENFTKKFVIDNFMECLVSGYVYLIFALPLQLGDHEKAAASKENDTKNESNKIPELEKQSKEVDEQVEIKKPSIEEECNEWMKGLKILFSSSAAIERFEEATKAMFNLNLI